MIYGEPVPKRLRIANLLAVATTAGAMAAVHLLGAPRWGLRGILAAWLAGHLGWGAYLAYHIREDS
jgi:hypothetical protein